MWIYREKDSIKNILEFLKHFSSRSHHKLFFGPLCIYILEYETDQAFFIYNIALCRTLEGRMVYKSASWSLHCWLTIWVGLIADIFLLACIKKSTGTSFKEKTCKENF